MIVSNKNSWQKNSSLAKRICHFLPTFFLPISWTTSYILLTISEVFTILCLLCLCGNKEYFGSFQNKSVSSSFKWVLKHENCPSTVLFLVRIFLYSDWYSIRMQEDADKKKIRIWTFFTQSFPAKLKGEGRSFWSGQE